MVIKVERFEITLTHDELLTIAYAIKGKLLSESVISHCLMHNGIDTLWYNYDNERKMLKTIFTRLDMLHVYDDMIKQLESKLTKKTN